VLDLLFLLVGVAFAGWAWVRLRALNAMIGVWVLLAVAVVVGIMFVPEGCAQYRAAGVEDFSVIEDPVTGGPPGPGVLPVSVCLTPDYRVGLRALVAGPLLAGMSLLLARSYENFKPGRDDAWPPLP
jgi:hypothetical protein